MDQINKLYTDQDFLWVKDLLGRAPRGLYQVMKYHPEKKHPMVIQVLPFVDKAPFPTLFWLTCPILRREISHIEKDGLIESFRSDIFSEGSENQAKLIRNHEDYRDERVKLFEDTIKDWGLVPEPMQDILKNTGIGGIAEFTNIKCFHLHYAHHLVRDNQVGKILDEKFNLNRFYQ